MTDRALVGDAAEPPHSGNAHLWNKDDGGGEPFPAAVYRTDRTAQRATHGGGRGRRVRFSPLPRVGVASAYPGYREERKASAGSEISWKGAKYQLVDRKGKVVLLRKGETVAIVRPADGVLFVLREEEKKDTPYGLIPSLGGERQKKKGKTSGKEHLEPEAWILPINHPWR